MPTGVYIRTEKEKQRLHEMIKQIRCSTSLKGHKFSEEHKKKLGELKIGKKNPQWKGDNVGYKSLHQWIGRKLGKPKKCNHCKETEKKLHWANKGHQYKRNLKDWISLCIACHIKYDKLNNQNYV